MKRLMHSLLLAAAITLAGPPIGTLVDVSFFSGEAFASILSPPLFVRGQLVCAVNVNRFLRKIGKRGTGSPSSLSFLQFRRTANPMRGDVVFNYRGKRQGHVQVYDGGGKCWNPSQRHGWILRPCNATWARIRKIYLRVK